MPDPPQTLNGPGRPSGRRSLSVGLCGDSPAWSSLLDSEGVCWHAMGLPEEVLPTEVFVLPRRHVARYRPVAERVLANGGAVVLEHGALPGEARAEAVRRRFPYSRDTFGGLPTADSPGAVEVVCRRQAAGRVYSLPFSLAPLWEAGKPARRHIQLSEAIGHPVWEYLCPLARKNVRRVVIETIQQAFFDLGLPLARKWYWPGRARTVFCLRGDMDGGPTENLLRFLKAVEPFAASLSLFVAGAVYADRPAALARARDCGAELGNHTFCHYVYPKTEANRNNLELTERLLERLGIRPWGFVGPAHFWHASMYRLLAEKGYAYASSFGLAHDDLPCHPVVDGERSDLLEIPFHCLGDRFVRFNMDLAGPAVGEFFDRLIDKKHAAGEPINLYGHPDTPGRLGEHPELVRRICERALGKPSVWSGQLAALAQWLRAREQVSARLWCEPAAGRVFAERIARPDGEVDVLWSVHTGNGQWRLFDQAALLTGARIADLPAEAPLAAPEPLGVGEVVHVPHRLSLRQRLSEWNLSRRRMRRKYHEIGEAMRGG